MSRPNSLHLYEEILLLALRDEQGTVATSYAEYALAGAIMAELLLERRVAVDDSRKRYLQLVDTAATGDPILDRGLERIAAGKRRASLQTWITRIAGLKNLRHDAARTLCRRGILRADEDKVLLLFTRKIYPEIDPAPEKALVDRLRAAVLSEDESIDPRTIVLISLAESAGLLKDAIGRQVVKERKKRIRRIAKGDVAGVATKEVIAAVQAAVMVAVILPAVISTN